MNITKTHVTAAGVAAFALVVMASSTTSQAAQTQRGEHSLTFTVHFSPFNLLDLGAPNVSEGDQLLFKDTLVDGKGHVVGRDGGFCVVTKVEPPTIEDECVSTYILPGGQITTQGLNTPAASKPFAITGGTGRYSQARGDGLLVENGDTTGSVTFNLDD